MHAAGRQSIRTPQRSALLLAARAIATRVGIGLLVCLQGCASETPPRLLLAPMIHGVELCQFPADEPTPATERELAAYCRESGLSPAAIIESTLSSLGPGVSTDGRFELGYTMPVPLLKLLVPGESGWQVDPRAAERLAMTVKETNRPVILHLFSTHFGIGAPIEEYLVKDPANLSVSPLGPMPKDRYYAIDIYPWSLVSTDNGITHYRQMAIAQFLDAVCRLPTADRRKIRAVTLLGELHHFHADFEGGMGVTGPYVVSDYSETSIAGFRQFLARRYGDIGALNRLLGEDFASFAEVEPPSKDLRVQKATRFSEHIDSSAHGKLPLTGWAFDASGAAAGPIWIRIYRNGTLIARVPARYGRQDVLSARPSIGTADVGWRYDMDFRMLTPGDYRLDFLAERAGGTLANLGTRRIAIMARAGSAPTVLPSAELPQAVDATGVEGSIDHPQDRATFYFNPLVPLWHEYRNAQVVRYLAHFERQVRASCLGDVPLYTHQIAPFVNPSWDATKFAVDASLNDPGSLRLGISLYGEPTYGSSFFDWLDSTGHRSYGVTEFHPLKAMTPGEVGAMLERHRQRGATFVSFFVDARPAQVREAANSNIFSFDPGNPQFGSDRLYSAIGTIMH